MLHVTRNIYYVHGEFDVMNAARHISGTKQGNIGLYFLIDEKPDYPCFVTLRYDRENETVDMVGYFYEWELPELNNAVFMEQTS